MTTLVTVVPDEFRAIALAQAPFAVKDFPLASDADAMDARRTARLRFLDAMEVARRLDCPLAARVDDEYALWLELRDPAQSSRGKNRLEAMLRSPDAQLGVVHFALQFGVKLDLDAVERHIDEQVAINGGITNDAALVVFPSRSRSRLPRR